MFYLIRLFILPYMYIVTSIRKQLSEVIVNFLLLLSKTQLFLKGEKFTYLVLCLQICLVKKVRVSYNYNSAATTYTIMNIKLVSVQIEKPINLWLIYYVRKHIPNK